MRRMLPAMDTDVRTSRIVAAVLVALAIGVFVLPIAIVGNEAPRTGSCDWKRPALGLAVHIECSRSGEPARSSGADADLWWWAGPGPTVSLALVLTGAY